VSVYQRAVPVLQVANVETSLRWYVDFLGFTPDTFPKSPPYSFAILRRDEAEIMLQRAHESPVLSSSKRLADAEFRWSVYLRTSGTSCSTSLPPLRRRRSCFEVQNECFTVLSNSRFAIRTDIEFVSAVRRPPAQTSNRTRSKTCALTS